MQTKEITPKQKVLNGITSFLQKYKIPLIVILGAIVAFLITFAIVSEVNKSIDEKSTILVENIQDDFTSWTNETDEAAKNSLEKRMLQEIDAVLEKYPKRYAGQRALFIAGNLAFEKGEWQSAYDRYITLAERFTDTYLAPIGLINAAVAMEEAGNPEIALETYERLLSQYRDATPETAKVLFSVGRINEELGNTAAALDSYNDLLENFPNSSWTNLARNRIIYLEKT